MKKNVGRIFNNRIVEGNKNIISKGEGFVSKESAVFIRTNNGFEGENPEPPVPPEPTNRILYTATTQPTSTWITTNCSENNFDSKSGKGYLVLNEGVTSLDGEYIKELEVLAYTIFKDYSGKDWTDNNITSVVIPEQITSIGDYAFAGCTSLTSIEIPSGVISIGEEAFTYCERLASVICEATTPPTLHHNSFTGIATTSCAVPVGCVSTYQTSAWSFYNGGYFITFTEIK